MFQLVLRKAEEAVNATNPLKCLYGGSWAVEVLKELAAGVQGLEVGRQKAQHTPIGVDSLESDKSGRNQ